MIREFIESWALAHNAYLAGWLIAAALALLGVLIVAKDQIFLGAAVTEASTLGAALAMWLGTTVGSTATHWHENDLLLRCLAVLFSVAATLLTVRGGGPGRETHEAITGWIFLVSSAGSILLGHLLARLNHLATRIGLEPSGLAAHAHHRSTPCVVGPGVQALAVLGLHDVKACFLGL